MNAKKTPIAALAGVCALGLLYPELTWPSKSATDTTAEGLDERKHTRASGTYGKLPLQFEANQGQTDERVKFLSRGKGYTLFLTPGEAVLSLHRVRAGDSTAAEVKANATVPETGKQRDEEYEESVLRMRLVGGNSSPDVVGLNELPGKANYFIGSDPAKWHTNVPTYTRVRYKEVYPGVDLVYYGNQGLLEHDFVVAPGADPGMIRLEFEGTDAIQVDKDGNLVLEVGGGRLSLNSPIVYQELDGARREVAACYVLTGDSQVRFEVAAYDHAAPLVIDPILAYSTYLGGSLEDRGYGIALDGSGNAYIAGTTLSTDFAAAGAYQGANAGGRDAFVTKLDPTGSVIVYSTYLGGSNAEYGYGIAVDGSGNAYVTGSTSSNNFPTVNPFQPARAASHDAFVTKLDASGSALVYSTYLGGSGWDNGNGIAVDASGSAYVTGEAEGTFPTLNPIDGDHPWSPDAFVTKFDTAGSSLVYSTYLSGDGGERGNDIVVDGSGNAYVTGGTTSVNFPLKNPFDSTKGGGTSTDGPWDAFVSKINPSGSALVYSTFLGGGSRTSDWANGIAVDSAGCAYVTGITYSPDFPTMNPIQGTRRGPTDGFVTKFAPSGTALVYSTYFGGSAYPGSDFGSDIEVDQLGNAYVLGHTAASNFPLVDPIQGALAGTTDLVVIKLNPSGSAFLFSTFLGGSDKELTTADQRAGIAIDGAGNVYLAASTISSDFPMVYPVQGTYAGGRDAIVAKIQTLCQSDPDCDDADQCTTDVCDPGDPGADNFGCIYGAVDCNDGNVCTDDTCISPTGCAYTNNTAPCDDGDKCTTNDICGDGVCGGTEALGCLDHFLCYKTKAKQEIPDVTLSDQFDTDAVHQVKTAKLFCTPADKRGEGIVDPDTHLMVYKVKGPHVPRTNIEVENQFGTLFFDTRKADTLMVPTAKSLPPDPAPGPPDPGSLVDHYRCLKVKTTRGTDKFPKALKKIPIPVTDQFHARSVYLKKPSKLCLPVDKNGEGIKNPEAHLLCYKVKAQPRTSWSGVQVNNQFGELNGDASLTLKKEAELCVPSVKVVPTTSTTTTSTTTTTVP